MNLKNTAAHDDAVLADILGSLQVLGADTSHLEALLTKLDEGIDANAAECSIVAMARDEALNSLNDLQAKFKESQENLLTANEDKARLMQRLEEVESELTELRGVNA